MVPAPKRYRGNLSLKKPVIHQNVVVLPPVPAPTTSRAPAYDEEGRLPESLPPTPIVDLITEDEAEVERTPSQAALQQGVSTSPPHPTIQELDPQDVENDAGNLPPPQLISLKRPRSGKSLALLASIREPVTSPSATSSTASQSPPVSPASQSPPASPTTRSPASPTISQTSQEDVGENFLLFVERAQRRVDEEKRKMARMLPRIRRRKAANQEEIVALRRHIAALQRRLEERTVIDLQCDAEILAAENFLK